MKRRQPATTTKPAAAPAFIIDDERGGFKLRPSHGESRSRRIG
jgi:hypothetical protein